jgi:hypothetical protein
MKTFCLIFLISICIFCQSLRAVAQLVNQEWVARYVRNPGGGDAQGPYYALDKYGNSFVAGYNMINGAENILVVKYNSSGVQQWATLYNYPGYTELPPLALALDTFGNAYVTASFGVTVHISIKYPPQVEQKILPKPER